MVDESNDQGLSISRVRAMRDRLKGEELEQFDTDMEKLEKALKEGIKLQAEEARMKALLEDHDAMANEALKKLNAMLSDFERSIDEEPSEELIDAALSAMDSGTTREQVIKRLKQERQDFQDSKDFSPEDKAELEKRIAEKRQMLEKSTQEKDKRKAAQLKALDSEDPSVSTANLELIKSVALMPTNAMAGVFKFFADNSSDKSGWMLMVNIFEILGQIMGFAVDVAISTIATDEQLHILDDKESAARASAAKVARVEKVESSKQVGHKLDRKTHELLKEMDPEAAKSR